MSFCAYRSSPRHNRFKTCVRYHYMQCCYGKVVPILCFWAGVHVSNMGPDNWKQAVTEQLQLARNSPQIWCARMVFPHTLKHDLILSRLWKALFQATATESLRFYISFIPLVLCLKQWRAHRSAERSPTTFNMGYFIVEIYNACAKPSF